MIQMEAKEEKITRLLGEMREKHFMKILDEIREQNALAVKRSAELNYTLLSLSHEYLASTVEDEIEACRQAMDSLNRLRREFKVDMEVAWEQVDVAVSTILIEAQLETTAIRDEIINRANSKQTI